MISPWVLRKQNSFLLLFFYLSLVSASSIFNFQFFPSNLWTRYLLVSYGAIFILFLYSSLRSRHLNSTPTSRTFYLFFFFIHLQPQSHWEACIFFLFSFLSLYLLPLLPFFLFLFFLSQSPSPLIQLSYLMARQTDR